MLFILDLLGSLSCFVSIYLRITVMIHFTEQSGFHQISTRIAFVVIYPIESAFDPHLVHEEVKELCLQEAIQTTDSTATTASVIANRRLLILVASALLAPSNRLVSRVHTDLSHS